MMYSRDSIHPVQAISISVASGGTRHRESDHCRASRVCASGSRVPVRSLQILRAATSCARIFRLCHAERLRFIVSRSPALRYQGIRWAGAPEWLVPDFCRHRQLSKEAWCVCRDQSRPS
jgi:hypothetical protein